MDNKSVTLEGVNFIDVKKSRLIGNNTVELQYNNGNKAIRLHNTNIITFTNNGNIIVNSGDWHTRTTKDRINTFTPEYITITQRNNIRYITSKAQEYVFYDNIAFNKEGDILTKVISDKTKKVNKIKRQVKNYVNLLDKLDKIPLPSNGDCWYCLFKDTKTGQTMGDVSNSDHILQHIKEGYIFGAILINAMREYGYNDNQIGIHYHMSLKNTFKRALRKYLYKRLIK